MFYFFPGLFCCRSAYGSTVACASPGNNCTRYAHTYSLPPITNCHLTCRRRQRRCTLRKCLSLGAYFQLILCICLNLLRITWCITHLCSAIWHKCSLNFQYIKCFSFCVFLKFRSYFQTQLNMGHCKRELSKVLVHRKNYVMPVLTTYLRVFRFVWISTSMPYVLVSSHCGFEVCWLRSLAKS